MSSPPRLRDSVAPPHRLARGLNRPRPCGRVPSAEALERRVLLSAQLVKDILPGSDGGQPSLLTAFGDKLVFATAGALENHGLWVSDGTDAGTTRIFAGMIGYDAYQGRRALATYDNQLLFNGPGGLWKTDGTAGGTAEVKALDPFYGSYAYGLTESDGLMYFVHKDGWYGEKVWRTDGTADGTVVVPELASIPAPDDPPPDPDPSLPRGAVRVGPSTWYYTANLASELWKTDGTPGGETLVKAFPVNTSQGITQLTDGAGTLYFQVNDGVHGYELWSSDGTEAGTTLVDDINPGPADALPGLMTVVDGRLYFVANDGRHGDELWKVDLPISAPAAPTSLAATPVSGGEVALTWADNADNESGFVLERSTTANFATIASSTKLLPDVTSHLVTGLAPGTTSYFRLRAFNRAGASSAATASAATPASPAAPGPFSATVLSHARVDLAWGDNSPDETGFRVERSLISNFSTIDATFNVGANVTTLNDTTVSPETHYFYRVSAVGPAGRSAAPRAHAGVIGRPPSDLAAWGVSAGAISLQWTNAASANLFSLRVERAGPGEDFTDALSLSASDAGFTDNSRRANTTYRYRVSAVGPFGRSLPSNEVSASTLPPVLATLVKDVNTTDIGAGSNPSPVVALNGVGYFAAEDDVYGRELWRTDGTAAGTWRVLDLNPGPNGGVYSTSETGSDAGMVVFNGAIYFRGNDGSHGAELWRSDGTEPGTIMVGDTLPGGDAGLAPAWLTVVNDTLFFSSIGDGELWKSDGTPAGTVRISNIRPGNESAGVANLVASNGVLYFIADDDIAGRELWRSDGTEAGTYRLRDIVPGPSSYGGNAGPRWLTPAGNSLYFSAWNPATGRELWKTDGTTDGTVLVKDINEGADNYSDPQNLFADGNSVLFAARDATAGLELWRSDGTADGTVRLADLRPGPLDSAPFAFTAFNGKTWFLARREGGSMSLYQTDGTPAGTTLVKELPPGDIEVPSKMLVAGETLYLVSLQPDGTGDRVLWKSDGTAAGTVPASGPFPYFPAGGTLSSLDNLVLFPAEWGGGELWRSDGTPAGTYQLKDIRVLNGDSNPGNLTAVNSQVFFTTAAGPGVAEGLWRSDGTADGTIFVHSGAASKLAAAGGQLFFAASDPQLGQELWTSDGTPAGTALLKDLTPGPGGSVISHPLAGADGRLYFLAHPASATDNDYRLWRSDGTAAGTYQVSDVTVTYDEYETFRKPRPVVIGNTIYFMGWQPGISSFGAEVWKSDGTAAGTVRVKNMNLGDPSRDSGLLNFTAVGQELYFDAWTPQSSTGLWKSDGTEAGTVPVDSFAGSPTPDIPVALGPVLIFQASDPVHGLEPWRSDGTPAGTFMLADIQPGSGTPAAGQWTVVGDTLYFLASPRPGQRELWKTDGTREGTVRVRSVEGTSGQFAFYMFDANGTLFYSDGGHLWRSDGTPHGTVQLFDTIDGATDLQFYLGSPAAVAGDTVFVRGYDRPHGRELWSVSTTTPAAPSEPSAAALGGALIRVNWRDNSTDETGFLVDRIASGPTGLLAAVDDSVERTFFVNSDTTSFIDSVAPGKAYRYRVRAVNAAGSSAPTAVVTPSGVPHSSVTARAALDGGATAPAGKVALPPGAAATSANVLASARGITGIIIDILGLPPGTTPTAGDFALDVGSAAAWSSLAAILTVTVSRGAGPGGADRVTLAFPANSVRNTWLRVTVKATAATGLSAPDVFYFGSLPGDTGNDRGTPAVNALDLARTRAAVGKTTPAALAAFDFNRDGAINALDVAIVRNNQRHSLPLFTAPAASTAALAGAAAAGALRPQRRGLFADPPPDLLA